MTDLMESKNNLFWLSKCQPMVCKIIIMILAIFCIESILNI
jgi:hypothetical protein